ncbi:MAG: sulfite exporter TauE/SafE family protein [Spirochaetales bacterium]|uniref:Probable membrane transporter protein n=1 Tax=Candidatus Thalassospirochaeta sargassi TaxID=3119039 RepID=A0AAJ1MIW8_9SPIO|nr:sulfite exporter TauE/SafE family protein [Spirochaetales bacterium]
MIAIIHYFIGFTASVIGAISGIGGGIIIKPVLDTFGFFNIATINFLSGCTVLCMSAASIIKSRSSEVSIDLKIGRPLAASGVVGGVAGKFLFNLLIKNTTEESINNVMIIQSAVLLLLTVGVLIFTVNKKKFRQHSFKSPAIISVTGLMLGLTGAFLGIGGGPINLMVLYVFFSMDSKTSALNSLFIIFFSQLASLIFTIAGGNIPEINVLVLAVMITGGISGAITGSAITKKLSNNQVDRLFIIVLILIIIISIKNIAL